MKKLFKKTKGWKTLVFGLITTALGFLINYDYTLITEDPALLGYVPIITGILTIILRAVTNSSIFKIDGN